MEFWQQINEIFFDRWEILFLFFVVAILYSSVGFGGGTSYLALLTLFGFDYFQVRSIALLCNIAVVSGSIVLYSKNNLVPWKKLIPLVVMSIPLAYLGGKIRFDINTLKMAFGISLLIAAVLMWFSKNLSKLKNKSKTKKSNIDNALIGGGIGFVSGVLGMGGGVFLAPFLYLSKWDVPQKIAAASSLFIFVNSMAGVIGHSQNPDFMIDYPFVFTLLVSVVLGGQIGTRMGIKLMSPFMLKRATSLLLAFVAVKTIWEIVVV